MTAARSVLTLITVLLIAAIIAIFAFASGAFAQSTSTSTTEETTSTTETSTTSTSLTTTTLDAPPDCQGLQSDCYSSFEGIQIGSDTVGRGCMNWSEPDKCFFVDRNCNYVFEPPGEVLMCGGGGGGGECLDIGAACTTNFQCCTGQCVDGVCAGGSGGGCCLDIGAACGTNADCCTGLCIGGVCATAQCLDLGAACDANTDCCSGFCSGGVCATGGGGGGDCTTIGWEVSTELADTPTGSPPYTADTERITQCPTRETDPVWAENGEMRISECSPLNKADKTATNDRLGCTSPEHGLLSIFADNQLAITATGSGASASSSIWREARGQDTGDTNSEEGGIGGSKELLAGDGGSAPGSTSNPGNAGRLRIEAGAIGAGSGNPNFNTHGTVEISAGKPRNEGDMKAAGNIWLKGMVTLWSGIGDKPTASNINEGSVIEVGRDFTETAETLRGGYAGPFVIQPCVDSQYYNSVMKLNCQWRNCDIVIGTKQGSCEFQRGMLLFVQNFGNDGDHTAGVFNPPGTIRIRDASHRYTPGGASVLPTDSTDTGWLNGKDAILRTNDWVVLMLTTIGDASISTGSVWVWQELARSSTVGQPIDREGGGITDVGHYPSIPDGLRFQDYWLQANNFDDQQQVGELVHYDCVDADGCDLYIGGWDFGNILPPEAAMAAQWGSVNVNRRISNRLTIINAGPYIAHIAEDDRMVMNGAWAGSPGDSIAFVRMNMNREKAFSGTGWNTVPNQDDQLDFRWIEVGRTAVGGLPTTTTTSTSTSTSTSSTTSTTIANQAPDWTPWMVAYFPFENSDVTFTIDENLHDQSFGVGATGTNCSSCTYDSANKWSGAQSVIIPASKGWSCLVAGGATIKCKRDPLINGIVEYTEGCAINYLSALPSNSATSATIFGTDGAALNGNTGGFVLSTKTTSGITKLQASQQDNTGIHNCLSTTSLSTATWYHGVARFDTDAGTDGQGVQTLFVNGISECTQRVERVRRPTSFNLASSSQGSSSRHIDECFFVPRALSDASVCRIYKCGVDGAACTCSGAAYSTGRTVACTPTDCNLAAPVDTHGFSVTTTSTSTTTSSSTSTSTSFTTSTSTSSTTSTT